MNDYKPTQENTPIAGKENETVEMKIEKPRQPKCVKPKIEK